MRAYSTKAYAASHMRKRAQLVAFSKAIKPFLAIPTPGKAKLAFDSAGQPPAKKPALENPAKSLALTMDRGDLRTPPHSGSILLTCSGNGMPVPPLGSDLRSQTE